MLQRIVVWTKGPAPVTAEAPDNTVSIFAYVDLSIGIGLMQICSMIIMLNASFSLHDDEPRRRGRPRCFHFCLGSEFHFEEIRNARLRSSYKLISFWLWSFCQTCTHPHASHTGIGYFCFTICCEWARLASYLLTHITFTQTLSFAYAQHNIHLTCFYVPSAIAGVLVTTFLLYTIFNELFFHFQCNFLFMRSQASPACHVFKCRLLVVESRKEVKQAAAYVDLSFFVWARWIRSRHVTSMHFQKEKGNFIKFWCRLFFCDYLLRMFCERFEKRLSDLMLNERMLAVNTFLDGFGFCHPWSIFTRIMLFRLDQLIFWLLTRFSASSCRISRYGANIYSRCGVFFFFCRWQPDNNKINGKWHFHFDRNDSLRIIIKLLFEKRLSFVFITVLSLKCVRPERRNTSREIFPVPGTQQRP